MTKPKLHKLKNGLRLILLPMSDSASVTVAVLVKAGSSYEDQKNSGISHFLEHMCFKGTDKYPRAIDVSTALEEIGSEHNAFTERDWTGYYAKSAPRYFARAFDVVSELYLHPHIDEGEIQKEKGVIIEEIHMYEDEPRAKISETLERGLYGNQPAGWSIAGTENHIKNTTRDMFISYRNARYVPTNTVAVVAGAFDTREAQRLVESSFGSLKNTRNTLGAKHAPTLRVSEKGDNVSIIERPLDQTHLTFGFYSESLSSKNRFAISLLTKVVGGSMSSRLFQRVREELGAAYYVGMSNNPYATHGYIDVFAGINHGKLEQVIRETIKELQAVKKKGITKKELRRAQDYSIGTFTLSLESSSDMAFYYAQQETVLGKMIAPQDIIRAIKAVSLEDVRAMAKKYINFNTMRFAVIGPYKKTDNKKFQRLLRGD